MVSLARWFTSDTLEKVGGCECVGVWGVGTHGTGCEYAGVWVRYVASCKTRMDRWFTSDTLERWEGVSVWVCGCGDTWDRV